ncbi:MAG TPA: hypothetical protein VF388_02760 [Lacunisphaera sp.]
MMPGYDERKIKNQLLVWWTFWAASLAGVLMIYFTIVGQKPLPPVSKENPLQGLIGVVPLFVSIVIRWLVVPRGADPKRAFVLFIVGVALAESCAILGMFLGGPYRDSLFVLGVLGITQYVPFYAKKLFDPKGSGFIPNN